MADAYIAEAWGVFTGTAGSDDLNPGDLVRFDGTDWELADADDESAFAEAMVVNGAKSGEVVAMCVAGLLVDEDAPFTQGGQVYVNAPGGSPSNGNYTETRPTGDNNLVQVVGMALSTSEVRVNIKAPYEVTMWLPFHPTVGTADYAVSADWAHVSLIADNDAGHATGRFPQNMVALETAEITIYNETALDCCTPGDITVDVSAAVHDEAGTAHEDGIAATSLTVLTADDIQVFDASAAFDGCGLAAPGNSFSVDVAKTNETAADDFGLTGIEVVVLCV